MAQDMAESVKILIVDDEYSFAEFARMLIESFGYRAILAGNATKGLELAASEQPDLILMDLVLPGMDGIEALLRLKSHPDTAKIPVILCSVTRLDAHSQAIHSGAADFIPKPLKREDLKTRIDRAMIGKAS